MTKYTAFMDFQHFSRITILSGNILFIRPFYQGMTILKAPSQPAYDMYTNNVINVLQISESHPGSRRSHGALMSL